MHVNLIYISCIYIKKVAEAAVQRCFYEKVFWKYARNLQENTHAKQLS